MEIFKKLKINFSNKEIILSFQHALAMFGATILIPILMGLPPELGLFSAGIGTLIYHFVTKNMIPVFLGSSAVYLSTFLLIRDNFDMGTAVGSLLGAGIIYIIVSMIIHKIGHEKIVNIFPNTVAGSVIVVIGITLVPVSFMLAESNYLLALVSAVIMIIYCSIDRGPFRIAPILLSILTGYIFSLFTGIVDFKQVLNAPWVSMPPFVAPSFKFAPMGIMAITGVIAMLEHFGDLTTNGMIVGKNHFESPGLHKSLLGAGLALFIVSLFGGTPTTTYGENNGVLAITKQYDPKLIRGAAIIAICLSFFGKFSAFLATIPMPVVGGVSFILFSMLAMSGINAIKNSDVNLMEFRNAALVMIPIFVGAASLLPNNPCQIVIGEYLVFSGISLAAIVGILLNLFFKLIDKVKDKIKI